MIIPRRGKSNENICDAPETKVQQTHFYWARNQHDNEEQVRKGYSITGLRDRRLLKVRFLSKAMAIPRVRAILMDHIVLTAKYCLLQQFAEDLA
jgi:hypothetical protein